MPCKLALLAVLIVGSTLWIYAPVGGHDFVSYDDRVYVTGNPAVRSGLSAGGLRWAFATSHAHNWHPLTWLSHMLDVELFGIHAGAHHRVSVGLHACNGVLLLLALRALGAPVGVAGFVALAFSVHPLRVESVAWVSERKDLLAGLFFMLALLAHGRYARTRAGIPLVFLALALGLLCKPMLVTLPLVLLLVDRWPMGRTETLRQRVVEKLPLLIPVLVSCAFTLFAQRRALSELRELPLDARLSNAFTATASYLTQTLAPHDLAVFYPHPALVEGALHRPWNVAALASALGILAVSALAWRLRDRARWLFVGWFWFLVTLVPVIGLVQVGEQARADRYAYLPTIGLYLILAGAGQAVLTRAPRGRLVAGALAALLLAAWTAVARHQVPVWRNSRTLFEHALQVTRHNWLAHNHLGIELVGAGDLAGGLAHYERALAIRPDAPRPLQNAALVHLKRGDLERAASLLRRALRRAPQLASAHATLGVVEGSRGRLLAARESFERALALGGSDAMTHANFGTLLVAAGDDALALHHLRRALALEPGHRVATERMGWVLATSSTAELRRPSEALRMARRAAEGSDDPSALSTLAAAHAANGQFAQAVRWQRKALEGATGSLQGELRRRLALYQSGKPFADEP